MMAGINADPDKLRELSKKLQTAGTELEQLRNQITRAFQATGWDDSEARRFEQQLTNDLKTVARIGQGLRSDYPKTLDRKARALDDFRR